jgi:O-antigen/teichoic acid export membrane protein
MNITSLNKIVLKIKNEPLFRNAFFIFLSRVFNAAIIGFLFWKFAANYYPPEEVGLGAALLASLTIIMAISLLGFDTSIIRFIKKRDKDKLFNNCFWITAISSVIVCIFYLATIGTFAPSLLFIQDFAYIFTVFAVFESILMITGRAYISQQKGEYFFFQTIILAIRVPLVIYFVNLGSLGILLAVGMAYMFAVIFSLIIIRKIFNFRFEIDPVFIKEIFPFSFMNYIGNLLNLLPMLIMPILILNLLNAEESARYFITYAIAGLILIIPDAISLSFFVEGSRGKNLKQSMVYSLISIYVVLVPLVISIFYFGDELLNLFGESYVQAYGLLKIFALSSFFVAIFNLFIPLQNIRLHVNNVVIFNFFRFALLLSLSYILIQYFGIMGVGFAWLLTYLILVMGIFIVEIRYLNYSGLREMIKT